MLTLRDYFEFSQLAQAAYANLSGIGYGVRADLISRLTTTGSEFTAEQADEFSSLVAGFSLRDHFPNDLLTGFSASLFESNANPGEFTLAIRGTEGLSDPRDLAADAQLAVFGMAGSQIVSMYRYYKQLTTPTGQTVSYSTEELLKLAALSDGILNPVTTSATYLTLLAATSSDMGLGKLDPGTKINVTGHSLGGHLAMAFARLFPDAVNHAYTYNAPGFGGVGVEILDRFTSPSSLASSLVTNILGDTSPEVASGLGTVLGSTERAFTEPQTNPVANHSIKFLTDALSVYDLFARLSPTVSLDTVTNILKAASYTKNTSDTTDETLETALDALRAFVADYQQGTAAATVAPTIRDNRDSFYTNLLNLQNEIEGLSLYSPETQSLGLTVTSLTGRDTGTLFQNAKDDLSVRYALAKLNPFAVTGNPALYSQINADHSLDRYDASTGSGNLTDQYLEDRTAFLYNKIVSGNTNASTRSGDAFVTYAGAPQIFEDKTTDPSYRLYLGKDKNVSDIPADEMTRIRFGAAGAEALYGSTKWDRLYGMAGDDTLQGGKGNDYLEGGQGTDTYSYTAGDGLDTVLDTDGLGRITFDGAILTGGQLLFGETYKSTDGKYLYTLLQKTTGQDLLVSALGGQIVVKDFQSGELGINLSGSTTPAPTSEFHGTANNDADLIDTGVPLGVAGGGVLDTNWADYVPYGQLLYYDPALDVGGMYFISRFGQPYPEGTTFDTLYGEGGDDYLLGNPGGHDFRIDGGNFQNTNALREAA